MTSALDRMRARITPLRLVIFDCDGVLVDSEPHSNRIVAASLSGLGWAMTEAEANDFFLGVTMPDMVRIIEQRLGRALPGDWPQQIQTTHLRAMAEDLVAIPGAVEALDAITALGLPWRIASNGGHGEMRVKFNTVGITERVAGRVHSYTDVARGKPAPDLFLHAAAAEGIPPAACVVIEDSVPGATAARAAGMDCLGYAPSGDSPALRAVGATPFASMFDLPDLIAAGMIDKVVRG